MNTQKISLSTFFFLSLFVCSPFLTTGCGGSGGDDAENTDGGDDGVADTGDRDSDGIADEADPAPTTSAAETDSDGDGVSDANDPDADLDGDGMANSEDADADGDGTNDIDELADLLVGTYDSTGTTTEQTCAMGHPVGTVETSTLTIERSEDGESLTLTGLHAPMTGWALGNSFVLLGSSSEEMMEGCLIQTDYTFTGSIEGLNLSGDLEAVSNPSPETCGESCGTTETIEGVKRE